MGPTRFGEVTIMSKQLNTKQASSARYQQVNVIEHLASQFVLGTLTKRVHKRVISLCKQNTTLEQRINFWQGKFVSIDESTEILPPSEQSWLAITKGLNFDLADSTKTQGLFSKFLVWCSKPQVAFSVAFSMLVLMISTLVLVNPFAGKVDSLSYVAVLTEQTGQAHLVASTYGESKKLVVNVVKAPKVVSNQDLELWVISKTDGEARSFGLISQEQGLIEQQLSEAQWRLIKDSDYLIVTVEEKGGSAIGEPSEIIVSRGLCVRLEEWHTNA